MLLVFFLGVGSKSYAQFLINENFRGKLIDPKNNIAYGGKAYLTAADSGSKDKDGEGWLRLTTNEGNQTGYAFIDQAFSSKNGVFVDFEFKSWGGNGADGIAVFLFDGSISKDKFKTGAFGGALGYSADESSYGLTGGYLGLGLDEFGNFLGNANGKQGNLNRTQNTISLRGKTVTNNSLGFSVNAKTSNLYLAHSQVESAKHGASRVDSGSSTRPIDTDYYRRVQIEMNEVVNDKNATVYRIQVRWAVKPGGQFYDLFSYDYTEKPYNTFKLGFAASTGGQNNYHEIRNLFATTPGGVVIEKVADKSMVNVNDDLTYTINLKGQNVKNLTFTINDELDAIKDYFKVESIEFKNNGNESTSTFKAGSKELKNIGVTLTRLGTVSFVIKGKVLKAPNNTILVNTAVINKSTLPSDIQKLVSDDQLTSSTSTQVVDPNFCGCPEGAKQMVSGTNDVTINSGDVYCVTGSVSIKSLTINKGGAVYVQSGAKLSITGNYKQDGGIVSICPFGGVSITGSATFGIKDGGEAKLVLKENAYFSVTGSLTHNDPGNGKAVYEMSGNSFIEVCGTYSQAQTRYPSVEYKGTGDELAYFINKTAVSGAVGSTISSSDKIAWLAFQTPAHITPGKALYCADAKPTNCAYWPKGLNPNYGQCNQVEELIDRTEPVGPDFCDNEGDKFISGFHSSIIKTATGFEVFGENMMPKGGSGNDYLVPTALTFKNGFNYFGSPLMATMGSHYFNNNQNFLLTTGGLYVWGSRGWGSGNQTYSVLDRELVKTTEFQQMNLPTGITSDKVRNMTASHMVLALLLKDGRIMINGANPLMYGDGTSALNGNWHTVSTGPNASLSNVELVRVHANGGLALTKDGKLYGWGSVVYNGVSRSNSTYVKEVTLPSELKGIGISSIALTGNSDSGKSILTYFVLGKNGKVYSIGDNDTGQLGQGVTTPSVSNWGIVKTEEILVDGSKKVSDLSNIQYLNGQDHASYGTAAAAIDTAGKVFFWGDNNRAMLGQPSTVGRIYYALQPQGLALDRKAVYVEVGGHTSMIVNDKNKYCYVGHKVNGSMGDGTDIDGDIHSFDCDGTAEVDSMCGILPITSMKIEKKGVYVDKDKNGKVNEGDEVHYTFVVTNTGNTILKNITITDDKVKVEGKAIDLNKNEINDKAFTAAYIITQKDIERGGVLNIATGNGEGEKGGKVTTTTIDPNPNKPKPTDPNYPIDSRYPEDNDKYKNCLDCTVTLLEQQPSITLVKVGVVDEDAVTTAGNGVINYTFTITNTGNVSLTLKDFKDSKITGFAPVFKQGEGTGSLEVGKTWTATATYTITDADVDAEKVENRAEVTGTAPKGKTTKAESKDEKGFDKPTITPVEGGGPVITNPHIYHKVQ